MIKEAFLVCAFALPSAFFNHPKGWSEKEAQIHRQRINKLKDRLVYDMPGYEIEIVEKGPPQGPGWDKIDIVYEGYEIYRRKAGDSGGYDTPGSREAFLEVYRNVHAFLEKQYPGHEFLIISHELSYRPPPGWTLIVHIVWDGYWIFKRPIHGGRLEESA